jgi:hypothetical protein
MKNIILAALAILSLGYNVAYAAGSTDVNNSATRLQQTGSYGGQ